jgi:hypothetical protein
MWTVTRMCLDGSPGPPLLQNKLAHQGWCRSDEAREMHVRFPSFVRSLLWAPWLESRMVRPGKLKRLRWRASRSSRATSYLQSYLIVFFRCGSYNGSSIWEQYKCRISLCTVLVVARRAWASAKTFNPRRTIRPKTGRCHYSTFLFFLFFLLTQMNENSLQDKKYRAPQPSTAWRGTSKDRPHEIIQPFRSPSLVSLFSMKHFLEVDNKVFLLSKGWIWY